jgi:DNA-directed RNA polymerase subunit RPC12/RpoP
MSKRYREYNRDPNVPVPRSTMYYQLKKAKKNDELGSGENPVTIDANSNKSITPVVERSDFNLNNCTSIESVDTCMEPNVDLIESTVSTVPIDHKQQGDVSIKIVYPNDKRVMNDEDEDENDDSIALLLSNDNINEYDLACGFLAAFFNGNITQASISDFLKLSNIHSPIKLPTSFDGLLNLLSKKTSGHHLKPNKMYYCSDCSSTAESNGSKGPRNCVNCHKKYFFS